MFNLDPGKLLVIAVVAIILLGPDRLPQVARQLGAAWRSFNEFRHRMESEVRSSMPDLPSTSEIARLARSPSALLNHLSTMSEDGSEESAAPADGSAEGSTEGAPAEAGPADAVGADAVGAEEVGAGGEGAVADVAGAVSGNGAHPPAGDNGSAATTDEVAVPPGPVTPASARLPQVPSSRTPETTVPVDPSLN